MEHFDANCVLVVTKNFSSLVLIVLAIVLNGFSKTALDLLFICSELNYFALVLLLLIQDIWPCVTSLAES